MSPELQIRIRHYADHLDALAAPVMFEELINREVEPVTMPEIERRSRPSGRRAWVGVAAALAVAALIGGAAVILGGLGSDPEYVNEPTVTTVRQTPETTAAASASQDLTVNDLIAGPGLSHPAIGLDSAGSPTVVVRVILDDESVNITHCDDAACSSADVSTIEVGGEELNVFVDFTEDGVPVMVVSAYGEVPLLHRCSDPACVEYVTAELPDIDGVDRLWLDPIGNPVMLIHDENEPQASLATCLDPICGVHVVSPLALPGPYLGRVEMVYGADGHPFFMQMAHDPEQRVNPISAIRCRDPLCTNDPVVTTIYDAPENTGNLAMALGSSGNPIVVVGNRQLQMIACADRSCAEISSIADIGPSMAISSLKVSTGGGYPLVTFAAGDEGEQARPMLAICHDSACSTGTIGTVDDTPIDWLDAAVTSTGGLRMAYGDWERVLIAACEGDGCVDDLLESFTWEQMPVSTADPPAYGPTMGGWTRAPHDAAVFGSDAGGALLNVIEGGPGLIAVGDKCELVDGNSSCDAAIWVSSDGFDWTLAATGVELGGRATSIADGPEGLLAVGGACPPEGDGGACDAAIWISHDASTWESIPTDRAVFGCAGEPACDFELAGVVPLAEGYLAWGGGFGGHQLYVSQDRTSWDHLDTAELPEELIISDVVEHAGRLVAVGSIWTGTFSESGELVDFTEDVVVLVSDDRVNWEQVGEPSFAGGTIRAAVSWVNEVTMFGSVCDETWTCTRHTWTSLDGLSWSREPLELGVEGAGLWSVAPGGPGLIASGGIYDETDDQSTTLFWTSGDGLIWDLFVGDDDVFAGGGINDFARLGPLLVGVGASPVERAPAVWVWSP